MRIQRRLLVMGSVLLCAAARAHSQTLDKDPASEALVSVHGLLVPPVDRTEILNMVDAGRIDVDGYAQANINLVGELKGTASVKGVVGAILIPDVPPFRGVFKLSGILPASFEIAAAVTPSSGSYFMAKQISLDVGFPRYRVLLYNTSGATASVSFFAYRIKR